MEMTIRDAIKRIEKSHTQIVSLELWLDKGSAFFEADVDFLRLLGLGQMDKVVHYNNDDNRHLVALLESEIKTIIES